jgi:hypothetical protein
LTAEETARADMAERGDFVLQCQELIELTFQRQPSAPYHPPHNNPPPFHNVANTNTIDVNRNVDATTIVYTHFVSKKFSWCHDIFGEYPNSCSVVVPSCRIGS